MQLWIALLQDVGLGGLPGSVVPGKGLRERRSFPEQVTGDIIISEDHLQKGESLIIWFTIT